MDSRTSLCALLVVLGTLVPVHAANAFLTDTQPHSPPDYQGFTPPPVGGSYTDPVFGSEIVRLSDALATTDGADGGRLTYAMNEYATMTAVNDDGSWIILQHDSYFALYDGQGRYVRDLPFAIHASAEPRWSRRDPNVLYFINGNTLKRHDVASGATSVVHTFSEYGSISGKGESDICFDGDHLVLSGDNRHIFVYEISTGKKGPVLDTGGRGFDSLYITPDDNVTVSWLQVGTGRYNGIELFDRNMNFQRQLARAGGHMDVTRDTDGSEVLVWTNAGDPAPVCQNGIVKIRLSDGRQTCVLENLSWSLAVHVSCADSDGSCIVGTYAPSDPSPGGNWPVYTNELLQVMLDGSEVRRLAHHRSRRFNGYNYTPRGSVSRDGTRLVFASNYGLQSKGAPTEYSDAYLIELSATGIGGGGGGGGTGDGGGGSNPGEGTDGGGGSDGTGTTGARAEETSGAVTFTGSWYDNVRPAHSGGSAKLAMDAGSRVKFTFDGTGARWIGFRDEWAGIARVYVDGKAVRTVDTYASPSKSQAVLHTVTGLPRGRHTLEVEVLQQIGASSSGAWVWVDAFEAIDDGSGGGGGSGGDGGGGDGGGSGGGDGGSGGGTAPVWIEETVPRLQYHGTWFPHRSTMHRNGSAVLSMDRGSSVRVPFNGTGIRWLGFRDEWAGIAHVYLDGKRVGRVDTYGSPSQARQVLFSVQGLPPGKHSLAIVVTGRRSKRSSGSWIWVDAFQIRNDG